MQSRSTTDIDLRLFYQNTQNQFNFLVLYITKFRQISSNDGLEMMGLFWGSAKWEDFMVSRTWMCHCSLLGLGVLIHV